MQNESLPNITSLRFFMAFLVMIFHIPLFMANRNLPFYNDLPVFNKGIEAVSLSGFLIIRNLFTEKLNKGAVSLKKFYKKRVLRIFPLYYSVFVFGLIYYNFFLPGLGYNSEPKKYSILEEIFLGGTFFSNILFCYKPGGIIEILWSIGIEEQFYLLIAPLFLLLSLRRIILFLVFFSALYFLIFHNLNFSILKDYRMYFYFFSFSGVIAVFSVLYPNFKFSYFLRIVIYLLVIIYYFTNIFSMFLEDVYYQLLSTLLFPLFIFSIITKPNKILENYQLKYLGKISYGIYMLHPIVMQVVGFLFLKLNSDKILGNSIQIIIGFNLLTIVLTILISHFSYKYFESIFLKYKYQ